MTFNRHDSMRVILDRLTKLGHFIIIKSSYSIEMLMQIYMKEVIRLYEALAYIVSYRNPNLPLGLVKKGMWFYLRFLN